MKNKDILNTILEEKEQANDSHYKRRKRDKKRAKLAKELIKKVQVIIPQARAIFLTDKTEEEALKIYKEKYPNYEIKTRKL